MKDGVLYDLDNLIEQGKRFSKAQIQLQELSERLDEKEKQVSDFETKQKKMTSAIEKQNDEICALKREKESLKSKVCVLMFLSLNYLIYSTQAWIIILTSFSLYFQIEELKKFMISVRDSFKKQEELLQS